MTKPRRSSDEHAEAADRLLAETQQQRDHITLAKAHPRKLVRNPCGDPAHCDHGCYGTEEEADHVRRTGLMPDDGEPPTDRGAGFTPPRPGHR